MDFRHLGAVRDRLAVAGDARLVGVDHYGIPHDHGELAAVLANRDDRPIVVASELGEREPAGDLHSVLVLRRNGPAAQDGDESCNDRNREDRNSLHDSLPRLAFIGQVRSTGPIWRKVGWYSKSRASLAGHHTRVPFHAKL